MRCLSYESGLGKRKSIAIRISIASLYWDDHAAPFHTRYASGANVALFLVPAVPERIFDQYPEPPIALIKSKRFYSLRRFPRWLMLL